MLAPALALFVSLSLSASALPWPPRSADSLIAEFAAAVDGKAKNQKKKTAPSRKPPKAPSPQPRPEAMTSKPASAEAKPKDAKTQEKPAEASTEPRPKDRAKIPAPLPMPRPDALTDKPTTAESKKNEEKGEVAEKPGVEKTDAGKAADTKAPAEEKTSAEPPGPESETAEGHLPAPQPKDFGPHPPPPGLVEADVPNDPLPDPVCDELEAKGEVEFERLPRIMEGQCGVLTPVRLKAFTPKDGPKVTLQNPATVTCRVASTALHWIKTSVQPAAIKHLGGTIRALRQTGGYECRGRNRDPKAKLSEHGSGNALDIGGFERINGVVVPDSDQGEAELGFLSDIRKEACGPFTTVLGPGVAAHADHFHFDLAKRGKDGRTSYCR